MAPSKTLAAVLLLSALTPASAEPPRRGENAARSIDATAGAAAGIVSAAALEAGERIPADQLNAQLHAMAERIQQEYRFPPEMVHEYAAMLAEKISRDPELVRNGVTRGQLNAFREGMTERAQARFIELRAEKERGLTPEERERLLGRVAELKSRSEAALEQAGPRLKEIARATAQEMRSKHGAGGDPGNDGAAGEAAGKAGKAAFWPNYLDASLAARGGYHAEAADAYTRAIAADPKNPAAWSGRASSLYMQGRFDGAGADARRALELNPGDRNALTVLKFSEARTGSPAPTGAAAASALAALGSGPDAGSAADLGRPAAAPAAGASRGPSAAGAGAPSVPGAPAAAPAAAAPAGQTGAARAFHDAATSLRLGDLAQARIQVERVLALHPGDPAALNLRASLRARAGDYAGAAEDARAGLAAAPDSAPLLRTLGFSLMRSRDAEGAREAADRLLAVSPRDAFGLAVRAHAEGSLNRPREMLADIRAAAAADPRFEPAAAAASALQLPSNSDVLFLFPGEAAAPAPRRAPAGARTETFGLIGAAAAAGGGLLALGLLGAVLRPMREGLTSVFTRLTRRSPAVGAAPAAAPAPRAIRGQYELLRPIGAGGMGVVFEGMDRSLGRRVAIKKMRDELRGEPRERARFVAEARTVAALRHPNVVDIYAIAEEGDDVYLVFEYVDGRTVHDVVRDGRLAPELAAKITRACADALEAAHARGIIHRDMKPSNVMIDGGGRVKVMDFGIARVAKDALGSMTNTIVGTPPYMAPEQERGQVRRESDVYALAICAYEMMTGRLPFGRAGGSVLLEKINMAYVPPSVETPGLPPALDAVFARAFQPEPEKRYGSAREFAGALEAAVPKSASRTGSGHSC